MWRTTNVPRRPDIFLGQGIPQLRIRRASRNLIVVKNKRITYKRVVGTNLIGTARLASYHFIKYSKHALGRLKNHYLKENYVLSKVWGEV